MAASVVPVLYVTWQSPESRRIYPIARVSRLPDGGYEWAYVHAVEEARRQGFAGLPGYARFDEVSVTAEVPALFAHRVRPRGQRRSGQSARVANDLFDPSPITLLVPLGAGRHERLEVFAPPLPAPFGKYWGVFLARGVGRHPGTEDAAEGLVPHEPLALRPEPGNPYNPHARLILRSDGRAIGYLPDYLATELAAARRPGEPAASDSGLRLEVVSSERVTHPPAPPVYSVACRYTCGSALGERLFRSERYQPLAPGAFRP